MSEPRIATVPIRILRRALARLGIVPGDTGPGKGNPSDAEMRRRTFAIQLAIMRRALDKHGGVAVHQGPRDDDWYLFRPHQVLVLQEDVATLNGFFLDNQDRFVGTGSVREELVNVVRYQLPDSVDDRDVPDLLDELDDEIGEGRVRPDHVMFVTPGWGRLCPATEPQEPPSADPRPALNDDARAGAGVRVSVVDTGWWEPAGRTIPWLDDVEGDPEFVNPVDIHAYAGHGTFVSGVVRCMAPATAIEVEGFLPHGGAVYESDICRELNEALTDEDHPDLISISAGTYTRKNLGLLAFEALARRHRLIDGEKAPLVIGAAGNDTSTREFYPAAYRWVLGVGALDDDGTVCDFSNTGRWVDVYAHGRDLVNAFPDGAYTCHEPLHAGEVRHFKGMAQWSGTSFATPLVSGLIAARMSAGGSTPRGARDELVAEGKHLIDPRAGAIIALGPPFV